MKSTRTFDRLYIGGQWLPSDGNEVCQLYSQHDNIVNGSIALATQSDMDKAVAIAKRTLESGIWSDKLPEERIAVIKRFDELHKKRALEIAELVTADNGIPILHTLGLQHYLSAQNQAFIQAAENFGWEERLGISADGSTTLVRREPVGVAVAVIPWNAPQQSSLSKVVPALLAGCSVILKTTPQATINTYVLAELFEQAGIPEGVFSILPADREVSQYLVSHADVDKIAFTGSTFAGQTIASIAGSQMKRSSMELGGKSAAIVLEDADLNTVVESLKYKSLHNNGQACVALTRVLLPENRYTEFTEAIAQMMQSLKIGNPFNEDVYIGPLYNEVQYKKVLAYIQSGIDQGAKILTGGMDKPEGTDLENGFYVQPTLFTQVSSQMTIAREEIFGPVLVAISYKSVDEAVEIANDSPYGLSGAVFTASAEKGLDIARKIKTGTITVNKASRVAEAPFGGYKQSGVGRENGTFGLAAFTEMKSISF